jgi:hypothetical protein
MPIITLSRQLGSGGDEIAQRVATRLGLRLVGRELINQAARQAGVPEVALAELDELGLLGLKPTRAAMRLYREKVTAIMHDLARAGDLLLDFCTLKTDIPSNPDEAFSAPCGRPGAIPAQPHLGSFR